MPPLLHLYQQLLVVRPPVATVTALQAYLDGGGSPDIEDAPRVTRFPGGYVTEGPRG
jgi:hypothetical protein